MFSIITPVHDKASQYLEAAHASLGAQSVRNWEWVIVTNNGGTVPATVAHDKRVRVCHCPQDTQAIGALKAYACAQATGEIVVELDADDLLVPNALAEIGAAFKDHGVAMAYSNSAEFRDGTWESNAYSEYYGWRSRPFFLQGHALSEMIAWPPGPQMMRFIFWAPNHVRAWRAGAYRAVGGHNRELKTGDDHELCCRFFVTYGARGFKHIDECLYLYRRHAQNASVVDNSAVQQQTLQNYLAFSRKMMIRWASDEGLALVDLGGRWNSWPGFTRVDLEGADITADLNDKWPLADDSVGVLRASHIFEHLRDPVHAMNEAFRVLAPGGWLLIEVPSTDGRGAWQDPTHVSFWNENSIWYYTHRDFARFVPRYRGRFQNSRTVTYFPTEFERTHNIPIVQADLIALKGDYAKRPAGEVLI